MPITVAVFDLGNVTLTFDPQRAISRVLPHCRVQDQVAPLLLDSEETRLLELGEMQPLEFYRLAKRRLGLDLSPQEFSHLCSDVFDLNEEALDLVRRLTGVHKYLLSNTNAAHVRFIRDRFPGIFDPYERLFLSHQVHLLKPDPAIFRVVLEASGRPPAEHVFTDDQEANVEAARGLGMQGIVFRSAEQLAAELAALGVRAAGP